MASESFELVIVTPERLLLRESCAEVQLPGANGYLGVLPGHAPLMTELGIGKLTHRAGKGETALVVVRGLAEVLPDRVTLLAEVAEHPEEIDLGRARAARDRAEKRLASQDPEIDWDRATAALQRSLIRIQVAAKGGAAAGGI